MTEEIAKLKQEIEGLQFALMYAAGYIAGIKSLPIEMSDEILDWLMEKGLEAMAAANKEIN